MRIGIDARNLTATFSGIGRYLVEMMRQLSRDGHSITAYLPSPPNQPLAPEINATLRVARKSSASVLQRQVWGQTTLARHLREDSLDVFWGPAHRLPALLPRDLARVVTIHDLVWHYHGDTMRPAGRLADRWLMPRAAALADIVVVDSLATGCSVQQILQVAADKIRLVYPGVLEAASESGNVKDHARWPEQFILFVGTLEPRKNLARLLAAYGRIDAAQRADFPLLIAGATGWGNMSTSDVVNSLGLQRDVKMLGFISESDLQSLYHRCTFVAFPSVYEGFGFPIVEANRAGKPVLTSNGSSMPEVAGSANFLVDPSDINSIAAGLKQLMEDVDLRRALGQAGPANAARFTWPNAAAGLVAAFEEAVARRRRTGR